MIDASSPRHSRSFPVFTNKRKPISSTDLSGPDLQFLENMESKINALVQKAGICSANITIGIIVHKPWPAIFSRLKNLNNEESASPHFIHDIRIPVQFLSNKKNKEIKDSFTNPSTQKKGWKKKFKPYSGFTKLAKTLPPRELDFIIAHEIAHLILAEHFKIFGRYENRDQIVIERVADFIGAALTSPQSAADCFKTVRDSRIRLHTNEQHPSLKARIRYSSQWEENPDLFSNLSKEKILKIGGPIFQNIATKAQEDWLKQEISRQK